MIEAAMLWNEPNNKSHWDPLLDPDWSLFADHVIRAGEAIASVNPGLTRVLGGMSPIDPAWLQRMAGYGALDAVDVVAVHGFPLDWNLWPLDAWPSKIAEIKAQLEEAKILRTEAEALRKEYADKIAGAEKDAAALIEHARHEAETIVAKAQADTTDVIARREKMAQDKIGAVERAAVTELRQQAAAAAAAAASGLIRANHSAGADKALVDQAIAGI